MNVAQHCFPKMLFAILATVSSNLETLITVAYDNSEIFDFGDRLGWDHK